MKLSLETLKKGERFIIDEVGNKRLAWVDRLLLIFLILAILGTWVLIFYAITQLYIEKAAAIDSCNRACANVTGYLPPNLWPKNLTIPVPNFTPTNFSGVSK